MISQITNPNKANEPKRKILPKIHNAAWDFSCGVLGEVEVDIFQNSLFAKRQYFPRKEEITHYFMVDLVKICLGKIDPKGSNRKPKK